MNFSITIRNTLDDLATAQRRVDRFLTTAGVTDEPAYIIRLCLEELVSNVIRHGYDAAGAHDITIAVDVRARAIEVVVEDDGREFDPSVGDTPEAPASLETAPIGGMGLPLVRAMAGPVGYARVNGRNRVTLRIGVEIRTLSGRRAFADFSRSSHCRRRAVTSPECRRGLLVAMNSARYITHVNCV